MNGLNAKGMLFLVLAGLPLAELAAHPLVSGDTGTQGAGKTQIELNTDHGVYEQNNFRTHVDLVNLTITRGLLDNLDVAINLPHVRVKPDGLPSVSGIGDITLLSKWRAYEADGLSLGLSPILNLPTGDDGKGLGNGKTSAALHGLMTYSSGPWTVIGDVGATRNSNVLGARTSLWNASVATLYVVNDTLKLLLDTGVSRNADSNMNTNPAFALIGAVWTLNPSVDLDLGYKHGLNHAEVKHSIGIGITLHF